MEDFTSFIFSHIPKCGGTSFRAFISKSAINSGVDLKRIYIPGYNGIKVNKNLNQLSMLGLRSFSKQDYKVIAMHVPYGIHKTQKGLGDSPLYFSLFRDPLERFLSHYYFFYYRQGADGCKGVHLSELPKERRSKMILNLSNIYASYILGDLKSGMYHDPHLIDEIINILNNENYQYGLLDNIEDAMQKLSLVLPDWLELEKEFPKVNAYNFHDTYKDRITEELVEEFNAMNSLDIKIYEYITKSFNVR